MECRYNNQDILHPTQNQSQVYNYINFYKCSVEAEEEAWIEGLHDNNINTNLVYLNKWRFFQRVFPIKIMNM